MGKYGSRSGRPSKRAKKQQTRSRNRAPRCKKSDDVAPKKRAGFIPASQKALTSYDMPKSVEEGRERVRDTERELLSCADRGGLRDRVVFVREPMAKIEAAKHANALNFHPSAGVMADGRMSHNNGCVKLIRTGLGIGHGLAREDAAEMADDTLTFDTHSFHLETRRGDVRLRPHVRFLELCEGDVAYATEICERYRSYLLAVLALNRVARGKAVSIVSWGGHARDYVTKQFLHLEGLVDYVGHIMHPEAILAVGPDLKAKIEKGKFVCIASKSDAYLVEAKTTFEKTLALHDRIATIDFFTGLYESNRDVLETLRKVKSDDAIAYWYGESTCPAARKAHKDAVLALRLAAMSSDARARYEANLWKPGHVPANAFKSGAANPNFGKAFSDDHKAKLSKSKLGNTYNTRPTTVRFKCPVPGCTFDTSKPSKTMKHHLSGRSKPTSHRSPYCQACGNVVKGLIAAGDTDSLVGNLSKWKKWTGLI